MLIHWPQPVTIVQNRRDFLCWRAFSALLFEPSQPGSSLFLLTSDFSPAGKNESGNHMLSILLRLLCYRPCNLNRIASWSLPKIFFCPFCIHKTDRTLQWQRQCARYSFQLSNLICFARSNDNAPGLFQTVFCASFFPMSSCLFPVMVSVPIIDECHNISNSPCCCSSPQLDRFRKTSFLNSGPPAWFGNGNYGRCRFVSYNLINPQKSGFR